MPPSKLNYFFKSPNNRYLLWFVPLIVVVLVLLYFFIFESNKDSFQLHFTPRPTSNIIVRATQSPGAVINTIPTPPKKTPVVTTTLITSYEFEVFNHPESIFELQYPSNWSVQQEYSNTVFTNPNNGNWFSVSYITPGLMDDQSISRLIDNREKNIFGEYDSYLETDRLDDPLLNHILTKKWFYIDGNRFNVVTAYKRFDEVVFILDFWSDQSRLAESEIVLNTFFETFKGDVDVISLLDSNPASKNLIDEDDFFRIEIPIYWERKQIKNDKSSIKTYKSPDNHVIFQTIVYNDGEQISKSAAADFVLTILNENYAKLTMIDTDRVCLDGREELTWHSYYSNYEGITYFETSGNALVIFTATFNSEFEEYYRELLDHVISTHNIHQINPCEG